MPTEYTDMIGKGATFKQYALRCARAFGALIHMRDDSLDSEIQMPELSTYHKDRLEEIIKELEEFNNKTEDELLQEYKNENKKNIDSKIELSKKDSELLEKYNNMLTEVHNYIPPTLDHVELKKFMISHIKNSINYDCGYSSNTTILPSFEDWKATKLECLEQQIQYHTKKWENEQEGYKNQVKWIEDLFKSLDIYPKTK